MQVTSLQDFEGARLEQSRLVASIASVVTMNTEHFSSPSTGAARAATQASPVARSNCLTDFDGDRLTDFDGDRLADFDGDGAMDARPTHLAGLAGFPVDAQTNALERLYYGRSAGTPRN
ncbi:hypothetical protein PR003_g7495 [Phytophthora rubi]|uniref:Uncharacterized protein n=1 Tax=Phytophthora rubi TaxID=129364 RepID=A0A6A4FLL8_9STRA|nr:hypothetical protein PR001_g16484 [Phytophthora rubi]KAE9346310.1 hypothetical protein PR003_g7495 [Phytophthora rubi]